MVDITTLDWRLRLPNRGVGTHGTAAWVLQHCHSLDKVRALPTFNHTCKALGTKTSLHIPLFSRIRTRKFIPILSHCNIYNFCGRNKGAGVGLEPGPERIVSES
jgi:hypothetical protein